MKQEVKVPQHEQVYSLIRDKILFGEFTPGQPITIQGLIEETGAGMTPVREALRRLTAEAALHFLGNRRITVPIMSLRDFDDICQMRLQIEPKLGAYAVQNADRDLIETLIGLDKTLDLTIAQGDNSNYLRLNYQFHFTLYKAAQAEYLTHLAQSFWLRVGPTMRIVLGRQGTANLPDHHQAIIAGLRSADPDAVAQAVAADIKQGIAQSRSDIIKLSQSVV